MGGMADHRKIHSPQHQTGMHLMKGRPACWATEAVAKAPGFYLDGKYCGSAMSFELWATALAHTPECLGCRRGRPAMLEQMEIDAAAPKVISPSRAA
jgi:hypothetical protein